jgi:diguanylate cyclase (GGDEF)-like protein
MHSRLGRYLLLLVLPSGLLCLAFLLSVYYEEQERVRTHLVAGERLRLAAGARGLMLAVGNVAGDVRLMASLPSLAAAIDDDGPATLERLAADFVVLSSARQVYDQLRWIDEVGMERVRVDFVQNRPFIIPAERLQNKSQRYFFAGAMALAPDVLYISPLDLNIENDRVEIPVKPVIRVALRVWDKEGRTRGIVIANCFGRLLLDDFDSLTQGALGAAEVSLLNADGYWLSAPNPADEWGFMFGREETFATRHAGAWQQIRGAARGNFEDGDGLWSFDTVQLRAPGQIGPAEGAAEGGVSWKLVSRIPGPALRQAANRSLAGWTLITLMFMGALFAGSYVLAQAQRRRDAMAGNLRALNRKLEEKVRQRTEELHQQAIRDGLTGLFNRRYLDETLPREIHRALRENERLAVVMIDLDHFKRFNDEWGHEAGDAVLLGVAELLVDGLRASDIACRYGGEELLVVMPGADAAEAVARMTAILGEVRQLETRIGGRCLPPVTFSAGVAVLPEHAGDAETLVRAADRALYMAKESGRNRIVVARPPGSVE